MKYCSEGECHANSNYSLHVHVIVVTCVYDIVHCDSVALDLVLVLVS